MQNETFVVSMRQRPCRTDRRTPSLDARLTRPFPIALDLKPMHIVNDKSSAIASQEKWYESCIPPTFRTRHSSRRLMLTIAALLFHPFPLETQRRWTSAERHLMVVGEVAEGGARALAVSESWIGFYLSA